MEQALAATKEKWVFFNSQLHLVEGTPLSKKIDLFAMPLREFFQKNHPQLLAGGSEIFWMTIFTAVLEAKTHSKEDVNAAIEQLSAKYRQGS